MRTGLLAVFATPYAVLPILPFLIAVAPCELIAIRETSS